MTVDEFRAFLLQFEDATNWPESVVQSALDEASYEVGGCRWTGTTKERGQGYYAAHWLITMYPSGDASDSGNASGSAKFAVASKSVGDESVSFNSGDASGMSTGDAWLASTQYGIQFMRLRKRVGMGAKAV